MLNKLKFWVFSAWEISDTECNIKLESLISETSYEHRFAISSQTVLSNSSQIGSASWMELKKVHLNGYVIIILCLIFIQILLYATVENMLLSLNYQIL